MIVANTGKITELIAHNGSLAEAHKKALLYVSSCRKYRVKRLVRTELGVFWKDVAEVGDYDG